MTPPNVHVKVSVIKGLGSTHAYAQINSSIKPFVSPEEAASTLINFLQCRHSVAELDCG